MRPRGSLTITACIGVGALGGWLWVGAGDAQQPQVQPFATRQAQFKQFSSDIIPCLVETTRAVGLRGGNDERAAELADAATFAYVQARRRLGRPFGAWNDDVRNEVILNLYLSCFVLPHGPLKSKAPGYERALKGTRAVLHRGALDQLTSWAALQRTPYSISWRPEARSSSSPAWPLS